MSWRRALSSACHSWATCIVSFSPTCLRQLRQLRQLLPWELDLLSLPFWMEADLHHNAQQAWLRFAVQQWYGCLTSMDLQITLVVLGLAVASRDKWGEEGEAGLVRAQQEANLPNTAGNEMQGAVLEGVARDGEPGEGGGAASAQQSSSLADGSQAGDPGPKACTAPARQRLSSSQRSPLENGNGLISKRGRLVETKEMQACARQLCGGGGGVHGNWGTLALENELSPSLAGEARVCAEDPLQAVTAVRGGDGAAAVEGPKARRGSNSQANGESGARKRTTICRVCGRVHC